MKASVNKAKLRAAADKIQVLNDQVSVKEAALAARRIAKRVRADASDETMEKRLAANRKRERSLSMKDADLSVQRQIKRASGSPDPDDCMDASDGDGPDGGIDLHEYKKLLEHLASMKGSTVAEEHKMLAELARAAAEKAEEHEKNFGSKEERKDSFITRRRKRVAERKNA